MLEEPRDGGGPGAFESVARRGGVVGFGGAEGVGFATGTWPLDANPRAAAVGCVSDVAGSGTASTGEATSASAEASATFAELPGRGPRVGEVALDTDAPVGGACSAGVRSTAAAPVAFDDAVLDTGPAFVAGAGAAFDAGMLGSEPLLFEPTVDVGPLDVGPLDVGPLDVGPLDDARTDVGPLDGVPVPAPPPVMDAENIDDTEGTEGAGRGSAGPRTDGGAAGAVGTVWAAEARGDDGRGGSGGGAFGPFTPAFDSGSGVVITAIISGRTAGMRVESMRTAAMSVDPSVASE
jgi:hypothetical protein